MVKTTRKVHEQARRKVNCCEIDQRGRPDGDVTGPEFCLLERDTQELTFGPKHHSETVRSAQNIILCCSSVGAKLMYLANAGVGLSEDLGILRRVCNR